MSEKTPSLSTGQQEPLDLKVGDRIILQHLATTYNNKTGTVERLPTGGTGRHEKEYQLLLDGDKLPVWIDPDNVKPLRDHDEDDESGKTAAQEFEEQHSIIYETRRKAAEGSNKHQGNLSQLSTRLVHLQTNVESLSQEEQITKYGRSIEPGPLLHTEFPKETIPKYVNHTWAMKHLLAASIQSFTKPHEDERELREASYRPSDLAIDARLGGQGEIKKKWHESKPPLGDICPFVLLRDPNGYSQSLRHSSPTKAKISMPVQLMWQ